MEAKTVNVLLFLTWSRNVIAKCSNCSKDIICKRQIKTCVKQMSPGCYNYVKFWIKNTVWCLHSWKTFAMISMFVKFCALSNNFFFFFMSCWLAHNQLSFNVFLFSGQLCLGGPGDSRRTVFVTVQTGGAGTIKLLMLF